jgi:hypothetical protein
MFTSVTYFVTLCPDIFLPKSTLAVADTQVSSSKSKCGYLPVPWISKVLWRFVWFSGYAPYRQTATHRYIRAAYVEYHNLKRIIQTTFGMMGVHSQMRQTLKNRIFFKRTNYAFLMVSNCSVVYSVYNIYLSLHLVSIY